MSENEKSEINPYQIDVILPSRGRFYGDRLPDGKVTIRPMTVKEEKLLAGGGNKLSLADKVLERCMISNTMPLKDMILTDKFFLLLNLRAISYGPEYTFELRCGCEFKFKKTITRMYF